MNCKFCYHRHESHINQHRPCSACEAFGGAYFSLDPSMATERGKEVQKQKREHERHMRLADRVVYAVVGVMLGYIVLQITRHGGFGPDAMEWASSVFSFLGAK